MRRLLQVLAIVGGAGGACVAGGLAAQSPGPLSLERALETALATSQVLRDARLGVRVADQQVREAWSSVLPDVTANASYSRSLKVEEAFLPAVIFDPDASPDELIPVRFGSDNTWQAGLSLEQPVFEYGVFTGVGAAARYRRLQQERMRGTTHDIVTQVRVAYLDALLAAEEVRLTGESVKRVRQTLAETRGLNRAGLASSYDVLRLDVQLANLEPGLRRAENAVLAAKRALLVTVGRDPREAAIVELEGRLNELDVVVLARNHEPNRLLLRHAGVGGDPDAPLNGDRAYGAALGDRSDLRQARLTLDLERARLAVERGEYFPKVRLFARYGVMAQQNGALDFFGTEQQRATSAAVGVRVELPVFNGFSREARVQQARARVDQAAARVERVEHEVARDVHTLLEEVREARRRAESQKQAVAQAQRGYEIASTEYRAGLGSQLQITDAEVALRQSEFNYARAVYDYLVASARLDAAMGHVPAARSDLTLR
jgi:outer membrane protein TolC